jgi:hypothetical protein
MLHYSMSQQCQGKGEVCFLILRLCLQRTIMMIGKDKSTRVPYTLKKLHLQLHTQHEITWLQV